MKKSNLIVFILALILSAQNASASVSMGPYCFVTAEIIEISNETKLLDSGKEYEYHYLSLKILSVDEGSKIVPDLKDCPVQKNQTYRAIDNYYAEGNYPASFKEGDKIKAGIEALSSMSSVGAVSSLIWSNITYENGATIKYKEGIVMSLGSDIEPIIMNNADNTKQGDITNEKNDDINKESIPVSNEKTADKVNINYLYLIIPILVIVGFLLYWFLRKRSTI